LSLNAAANTVKADEMNLGHGQKSFWKIEIQESADLRMASICSRDTPSAWLIGLVV
jgi:hypothetical protein